MDDTAAREAIDAAGVGIWLPPHLEGPGPDAVALLDLIGLPGGGWLAIGRSDRDRWVTPVTVRDGVLRRARPGDGVIAALLRVLAVGGTGALAGRRHIPVIPTGGDERAIEVDQSNESVVVGERVVVKLYPHARSGPQPGLDLPAHLVAVGFAETPAPLGALTWRDDTLVASMATYVPGARDGWEWYVELLETACAGAAWSAADAPASMIGGLVARLHRAFATASVVFPSPIAAAGRAEIARWRARADATLDDALASTDGAAGARLTAVAPRARSAIAALDAIERTPVLRIHGDLHVGQVLQSPDGRLVVSDFDGDPLTPPDVRSALDAPARDVAAMARAIDHVGRVVAHRHPEHDASIVAWTERSRAAFLSAYRAGLGDRGDLFDERLLRPLEVEQEAHEYVYAARYLPRWLSVPDAAMPALLGRSETVAP